MRGLLAALLLTCLGASALGAVTPAGAAQVAPFVGGDMARGRALATACVACHFNGGIKVDPRFAVPRIANQHPQYLVRALQDYRSGNRSNAVMQAFARRLSKRDMRDLAAYFGDDYDDQRSKEASLLALPPSRPGPAASVSAVPPIVVDVCGACHGESGGGELPEVPSLAGQHADYILYALEQYRQGGRRRSPMIAIAAALSQRDMVALAAYFSRQSAMPFSLRDRTQSDISAVMARMRTAQALDDYHLMDTMRTAADVVRSLNSEMVALPGGAFVMGDDRTAGFAVGWPRHQVTLRAFRLSRNEITFDQYDVFARASGRPEPDDEGWGRGQRPVINVTWLDMLSFVQWLNRVSGKKFRLPTEAEYEYAERGGTRTVYWWGDRFDREKLNAYALSPAGADHWLYTAPVGRFVPNPFGLDDMNGNVWERVADCWHGNYRGAPTDGAAWLAAQGGECSSRVIRGGAWNDVKRPYRSSARGRTADTQRSSAVGFRVAQSECPAHLCGAGRRGIMRSGRHTGRDTSVPWRSHQARIEPPQRRRTASGARSRPAARLPSKGDYNP